MNILVNDVSKELPENASLQQAMALLALQTEGAAVAVNREIIHPQGWAEFILNENDELVVFKLVAGG
ncbi:sulfur carrier protein ThiS [Reinekea marinisedimentorum]|uniref:Thiamine biosynthesis protein ThiS n=1 Tax=Reinekea marinisedimentorum TaxID=230495 RepID=A0A4R3IAH0_9GAMM|nr:sulfur carrier protein ThiS [Reinekea marinisedimentorum]TCS43300.1 thiamine biosynthesis protein ThiS [Reinekea marinisedimentorum]